MYVYVDWRNERTGDHDDGATAAAGCGRYAASSYYADEPSSPPPPPARSTKVALLLRAAPRHRPRAMIECDRLMRLPVGSDAAAHLLMLRPHCESPCDALARRRRIASQLPPPHRIAAAASPSRTTTKPPAYWGLTASVKMATRLLVRSRITGHIHGQRKGPADGASTCSQRRRRPY